MTDLVRRFVVRACVCAALSGAASAWAATPAPAPASAPDGVLAVDFERLASYPYAPPRADASPLAGVPEAVRALDGRRVRVTGFMLPLEIKDGGCRQFLILRNQAACCYGQNPLPTEWIMGTSAKGISPDQDTPLSFTGTLRVGAKFENGQFSGVYSLEVQDEPSR